MVLCTNCVCCFTKKYFFIIIIIINIEKAINKSTSKVVFRATVSAAMVINRVSKFSSGHTEGRESSADFGHKKRKSFLEAGRTTTPNVSGRTHLPPPLPHLPGLIRKETCRNSGRALLKA